MANNLVKTEKLSRNFIHDSLLSIALCLVPQSIVRSDSGGVTLRGLDTRAGEATLAKVFLI